MTVFLSLLALVAAAIALWRWRRDRIRRALLAAGLSATERALVARHVPLTTRLPAGLRERLEGRIRLFLHQIDFIGCNGLEVTDAMRLSIAAQASLLVVNTDAWYRHLRTVLIYPAAFRSRQTEQDGYVVTERETVRFGESWQYGPVVLSWADTERGALDDRDGHNVVLHEFAHQLDSLSGDSDGVPILSPGQSFDRWAEAFDDGFERHLDAVEAGRPSVIDPYGAEGHEEFFATAIEAFFERPGELQREYPEIYRQLSELLRLDPATWSA